MRHDIDYKAKGASYVIVNDKGEKTHWIRRPIEKMRESHLWQMTETRVKDRPSISKYAYETDHVVALSPDFLLITNKPVRHEQTKSDEQTQKPIPLHILRDMQRPGRIQDNG